MADAELDPNRDTIIVAEDSAPNRKILTHLVKKLDFQVIDCENGREAWTTLESTKCKVVAVLSDIMMPEMDGIEFLKLVRESEKFKHLPFMLITAILDKDYIVNAKKYNVNGYILKPVTFDRITEKLKSVFPDNEILQKVS